MLRRFTSAQVDREIVKRRGLYAFAQLAWNIVDPSSFVGNWHLELLCAHLEAVSRGECRRLVVNMPPGTGKSLFVDVFWPAWHWIEHPADAWLHASFDDHLVNRDADRTINLLRSSWFVERWGELLPGAGKPSVTDFRNARGGHRMSTTIKGKATGHHANIHSVNDPIKPLDAAGGSLHSKTKIEEARTWYHGTMSTRFRELATSRRVLTMQRLNEDDLAGECIADGYTALVLPMRYDPNIACITPWGRDPRTETGELLFPDRFPEEEVEKLEAELGPADASAQLGQRPVARSGAMIEEGWIHYWSTEKEPLACPTCEGVHVLPTKGVDVLSGDCTFKDSATSDLVALGALRYNVSQDKVYVVDLRNERLDLPATCNELRAMSSRWPRAFDKLIEDKANGPAVEQTLRQELPGITLVTPEGGKIARVNACAPAFAAGRVLLPHPAIHGWSNTAKHQITKFPRVKNDDIVDMITQAVIRLRRHGSTFAIAMAKLRGELR